MGKLHKLRSALNPGRREPEPATEPAPSADDASTTIRLDYPVHPRARFGHDRPPHPQLSAILAEHRGRYEAHLRDIVELAPHLRRIAVDAAADPAEPYWCNGWLPGLDAAALYDTVVRNDPRIYLEVGSGHSTRFCRRAIRDHGLRTRIVSIDPLPRAEVDAICDEVVRSPLEDADLAVFDELAAGDVLFVDNSHRVFTNSDATVVFLEVLPRLPAGVLVELHDIFLPEDYPDVWNDRFYSEQYVLAGFLLGGERCFTTELPCWYVSRDPELAGIVAPVWDQPGLEAVERHGHSFWLVTV